MITFIQMDRKLGVEVHERGMVYRTNQVAVDTNDLRELLRGSKRHGPTTPLSYYQDSDGNKYIITGDVPKDLPDPVRDRREEGRR